MHFNGLFHYLKRPSTNRRIPRRKHSYRTRPPPVYTLSYKSWPLKIQPVSKTPFLFYYTMYLSACLLFFPFQGFFLFLFVTIHFPGQASNVTWSAYTTRSTKTRHQCVAGWYVVVHTTVDYFGPFFLLFYYHGNLIFIN